MANTHNIYQYFVNNKQNYNLVQDYLRNASPIIYMNTIKFTDQDYIESRRFGAGYTNIAGQFVQYRPDEQYFFNDASLANDLSASFINIDTQNCPNFTPSECEVLVFDSYGVLVNIANMYWAVKKGSLRLFVRDINVLNADIKLISPGSSMTVVVLRKMRPATIINESGSFLTKQSYTVPEQSTTQVSFYSNDSYNLYPPADHNFPVGPEYIRVMEKHPSETHYRVVEQSRLNVIVDTAQRVQVTVGRRTYPRTTIRSKMSASQNSMYIGVNSNILKMRMFKNYYFSTTFDNTYVNNQELQDIKIKARIVDRANTVTLANGITLGTWYDCTVKRSANNGGGPASWYVAHPGGQVWITAGNMSDVTAEVTMDDLSEMIIPKDTTYQVSNGFEFHKIDCRLSYYTDAGQWYINKQSVTSDSTVNLQYLPYNQTTGLYEMDQVNPGIPLMAIPSTDGSIFPIPVQKDEELLVFLGGYKLIPGQDYKIAWPSTDDNNIPFLFINLPKHYKAANGTISDVDNISLKVIYNGPMANTLTNQMISSINLSKGNFFSHKFMSSFDRNLRKGLVSFHTDSRISEQEPQFIAPFMKSTLFFNDRKLIHPDSIEVISDSILAFRGAYTLQNLECVNMFKIDVQSGMILADYLNQFEQTGFMKFMTMIGAYEEELLADISNYHLTDYSIPENAKDNRSDRYFLEKILDIESTAVKYIKTRQQYDAENATFYRAYTVSNDQDHPAVPLIIDSNEDNNSRFDYDLDEDYIPFDIILDSNSNSTLIQDSQNSKEIVIILNGNPV